MEVLSYNLPDSLLIDPLAEKSDFHFWIPDRTYLVLGQSNRASRSLYENRVLEDEVPVYKRPSGGESVILTPKTLVISVRLISDKLENPQVYFRKINGAIIQGLEKLGIKNVGYRGISDITIGHKKILGSSIYRKKKMVFYHSVMNISEDISLIGKYLQHPPKEPDYRKGRDHKDFVTSIHEAGYPIEIEAIRNELNKEFSSLLNS